MSAQRHRESPGEPGTAGFAVLDDKGRISLPKPLRGALGLHAGSAVAYIRFEEMILLIPQDEHLAVLMERAVAALEAAGITVDDFLANLPAARDDVVHEAYGEEFMQDLLTKEDRVMPRLSDSHPCKWTYDLHTRVKHEILMRYLNPWTTILGNAARSLAYVDSFAGRGRYAGGQAGSPLLVLDAIQDALTVRRHQTEEFVCHFVEADDDNFANLQAEVQNHPAVTRGLIMCRLYNAPFSSVSDAIISEVRRLQQPSFFFVDPFGYEDTPMATLGQILGLPKAEVFVNLMFGFINRAIGIDGNPALAATLDRLFGSPEWRSIAHLSKGPREHAFIELYRQQLKQNGAAYVIPFRMGDDTRDRTLYYLVHATKHLRGALVMKDVMVASGSPGELGYAGENRHLLLPLFDLHRSELPSFLMGRFAGKTVTFDDVVAATIEETGTCRETDYRSCLKELEKQKWVSVRRVTSKTSRGLSGQDEITFLSH
jgi:three-Cys-motif partner protein